MKNILLALTLITLTFLSCSNEDDDPPLSVTPPDTSLYAGTWSGTFSGDSSGTFTSTVFGNGTAKHNYIGPGGPGIGAGSISKSGELRISFSNGGGSVSQLNAETEVLTGTWHNPDNTLTGTTNGTKD